MTDFILAGTGPRSLRTAPKPVQEAAMDACLERLATRLFEHGSRLVVMSGLGEGWDECLARAALRLEIRLWCAIPNKGYGRWYWGERSETGVNRLDAFNEIVGRAWKVTYVMEQIHGTSALKVDGLHANFWRNLFMVNGGRGFPGADDFAVLGPVKPRSGTAHCVKAIRAAGKWRDDMVLGPALSDPGMLPIGSLSGTHRPAEAMDR
jgi:hypothetical protein